MRASIFLISALCALAGCDSKGSDGDSCQVDDDCDSGTCARTDVCAEANEVRPVHVTWTVQGAAPTAATCASLDPLELDFDGFDDGGVAFEPVPCIAGLFSIDKLPNDLDRVTLVSPSTQRDDTANIDANGNAALDLP
jgi:hypothetical protein